MAEIGQRRGKTRERPSAPLAPFPTARDGSGGMNAQLTREQLYRSLPWDTSASPDWAPLVEREWLVANGLGGYASGTVAGATTRRYHGLLIAAEPPPLGRTLTLV